MCTRWDQELLDIFRSGKQICKQPPYNLMTVITVLLGAYFQLTSTFTLFPIRRYFDFVDTSGGHMKLTEGEFASVKWKIRRSSVGVKYRRQRGSSIRTAFSSPLARAPRNQSKTCVVWCTNRRNQSVKTEKDAHPGSRSSGESNQHVPQAACTLISL